MDEGNHDLRWVICGIVLGVRLGICIDIGIGIGIGIGARCVSTLPISTATIYSVYLSIQEQKENRTPPSPSFPQQKCNIFKKKKAHR